MRQMSRQRSSRFGSILLIAVAAAGSVYFFQQSFGGQFGLEARETLQTRATHLRDELTRLEAREQMLERQVSQLGDDQINDDLLETKARAELHFARSGDVIVR